VTGCPGLPVLSIKLALIFRHINMNKDNKNLITHTIIPGILLVVMVGWLVYKNHH
jgi:hypothetical protein